MRFLIFATLLICSRLALATEVCTLNAAVHASGVFDRQLFQQAITLGDTQNNAYFIYIKRDGSVVQLRYEDVLKKKNFADLNHAEFFTFRYDANESIEIGYGDVNTARGDVRMLKSVSYGSDSRAAAIIRDKYWASCLPR